MTLTDLEGHISRLKPL